MRKILYVTLRKKITSTTCTSKQGADSVRNSTTRSGNQKRRLTENQDILFNNYFLYSNLLWENMRKERKQLPHTLKNDIDYF